MEYAVFRNGSNSINQNINHRAIVWVGLADNPGEAIIITRSRIAVYKNIMLEAIKIDSLMGQDAKLYKEHIINIEEAKLAGLWD